MTEAEAITWWDDPLITIPTRPRVERGTPEPDESECNHCHAPLDEEFIQIDACEMTERFCSWFCAAEACAASAIVCLGDDADTDDLVAASGWVLSHDDSPAEVAGPRQVVIPGCWRA